MRLLLDTHTVAWWSDQSASLPERVSDAIGDRANTILISAVSAYELALKHRLGKWPEAGFLVEHLDMLIDEQGFIELPVSMAHARVAGRLPTTHRDPFDRMLAAQALVEGLTIVSIDDRLDRFDVSRLW